MDRYGGRERRGGQLQQYSVDTGALIGSIPVAPTGWHNNPGSGDQIVFDSSGTIVLVKDNSTCRLQFVDLIGPMASGVLRVMMCWTAPGRRMWRGAGSTTTCPAMIAETCCLAVAATT
jgi:hypothetical protein